MTTEELIALLEPQVPAAVPTAFVVESRVKGHLPTATLVVKVDTPAGITVDELAVLNRQLRATLEAHYAALADQLALEVSSPGADAPLRLPQQFPKHIGRRLRVERTDGTACEGELTAATTDVIRLRSKGPTAKKNDPAELLEIALADIQTATVQLPF